MNRDKAILRIIKDLNLPFNCEDYVIQTLGRLGCDDNIDIETINAIEQVIRNDLRN